MSLCDSVTAIKTKNMVNTRSGRSLGDKDSDDKDKLSTSSKKRRNRSGETSPINTKKVKHGESTPQHKSPKNIDRKTPVKGNIIVPISDVGHGQLSASNNRPNQAVTLQERESSRTSTTTLVTPMIAA